MVFIANAENRGLFESELAEMHRQRKTVFVDGAGWRIPVISDREVDTYDREDTVYLLAKDHPDSPLFASARLLTTTGPHLMSDLFSEACPNGCPRGPTTWEVSRFCTAPAISARSARPRLLWEIICAVLETALVYGIDELIFAANRALLPLALRCGWEAEALGPALRHENEEVTAVLVAVNRRGLRNVRQKHCIPVPVIRLHAGPGADRHPSTGPGLME